MLGDMIWYMIYGAVPLKYQYFVVQYVHLEMEGGEPMVKNTKQTSKRAASAASKVLRDGRTSKASKTAAGSAL